MPYRVVPNDGIETSAMDDLTFDSPIHAHDEMMREGLGERFHVRFDKDDSDADDQIEVVGGEEKG